MRKLNFLSEDQINEIKERFRLPCFVYSQELIKKRAKEFLDMENAFGLTVRYAMKANSNKNILKIINSMWIHVDASSEHEVYRAVAAWVSWDQIQISWQELTEDLEKLINTWVFFVATSLRQLEEIWKKYPGKEIWVRLNPWLGSADFNQINTWWHAASFWIWYEYIDQVLILAKKYNLKIVKIHIHIGSENTPESWMKSAQIWLDFVERFEDTQILNLWWWFKLAIMDYEKTADLKMISEKVSERVSDFYNKTSRKIRLEVEPWKYLVLGSCSTITKIQDIVDTWKDWYKYIKINSWMTEMPRTMSYWVQQPLHVINDEAWKDKYVVVGHCCESSDLLTCKLYEPETIEEFELNKPNIWDILVVENTWAYNSSMSYKNYNSFPEAWEVMVMESWEIVEIRKRQELGDIWKNEIMVV